MKDLNPIVVTSINPTGKMAHQRLCFERWRSLGMRTMTCNTQPEARVLAQSGFPEECIRLIPEEHSGQSLFGKPVPLIKPLLEALYLEQPFDCLILTNSDIYPAIRTHSIVRYWATHGPALALTRDEIHDLAAHDYDSSCPYRGGLDVFVIQRDGLTGIIELLGGLESSSRMAFGMPGWDYLMAATLLSPRVGGRIFDSHVLIHQSHKPTYGSMDEFSNYVEDLKNLGAVSDDDPAVAAAQFASLIEQECRRQHKDSSMARLLYYQRPERHSSASQLNARFERVWQQLIRMAPAMENCYRKRAISSLYQRLLNDPEVSFEAALPLICNSKSTWFQFHQALFAIVLCLKAHTETRQLKITENYPKGNQHRAALRNIIDRHDENDPLRRLWIARLFGSELVNHQIFNPRLFDYLVLASQNDSELQLTMEILSMTRSTIEHAA
jgi:hypothetical protein